MKELIMKKKQDRLIIWAAKGMFKSARKLANALKLETNRKVLIVRSTSLRFIPKVSDKIINWGNSHYPQWADADLIKVINFPENVAIAINKLKTFQQLQGEVSIPEWTTSVQTAINWMKEGKPLLCRHKLTGFGGDGIELIDVNVGDKLPPAQLYVQYKKKKKEFRVHVFNEKIIDITQKKKRTDYDGEVNTKIRNYANGWVYCREDIDIPDDVKEQAIKAVRTLGLNFGAVDIIWNEKEDKAYVLEINTAPGLEGTTIEAYKNAILQEINPQVPPNDVRRNDQF